MAITSYYSRFLVPTRTQITALKAAQDKETVSAPKPVPVPVIAAPSAPQPVPVKVIPVIQPPPRDIRGPILEGMVRTSDFRSGLPVVTDNQKLTPHDFSTCATCGGETMTDVQAASAAPAAALPAPAPAPPAAPTPAPATPTATPKKKSVAGWVALAALLVIGGGLILGAVTRPRTK